MNRQGSSSTCGGYYDSKSVEIKVTRRVKEAIHIGLHSNNINRDSGIEIPEAEKIRSRVSFTKILANYLNVVYDENRI